MLIAAVCILLLAFAATPAPSAARISTRGLRSALTRLAESVRAAIERRRQPSPELGMLVGEAASRLRAGATPDAAWSRTLENAGLSGASEGLDESGVPPALRDFGSRRLRRPTPENRAAIASAVAVCRLSHSSGAPMADVLDSCAEGITEAAEAASSRAVALAGPQTSAQMIAWMPLIGVVLGSALGAEPMSFLLSRLAGRLVLGAACILEAAGIVWIRRLVASAERTGQ